MINLDFTYCLSTECTGECGRQLPEGIKLDELGDNFPIWGGCFCDDTPQSHI